MWEWSGVGCCGVWQGMIDQDQDSILVLINPPKHSCLSTSGESGQQKPQYELALPNPDSIPHTFHPHLFCCLSGKEGASPPIAHTTSLHSTPIQQPAINTTKHHKPLQCVSKEGLGLFCRLVFFVCVFVWCGVSVCFCCAHVLPNATTTGNGGI